MNAWQERALELLARYDTVQAEWSEHDEDTDGSRPVKDYENHDDELAILTECFADVVRHLKQEWN